MSGHNYPMLVSPPAAAVCDTGLPPKTGQTTSYAARDDGDDEFGAGVSILELSQNNPFGHKRRFTGITGGYHNGTTWVDKNGNNTTEALAFPFNLVCDFGQYSSYQDQFPMIYRVDSGATSVNWDNGRLWANALNINGWTDFRLINARIMSNLIYHYNPASGAYALNYPPFNNATFAHYWTGTNSSAEAKYLVQSDCSIVGVAKTTTTFKRALAMRMGKLSDLTV